MIGKTDKRGQTALILILLSAAALIFLAITYNWGRVSQVKTLLTVASDQSAALLASDAASYGEMQKQTSLQDRNKVWGLTGLVIDVICAVIAIIAVIVACFTYGIGLIILALIAVVLALAVIVLEVAVVEPEISSLWNKLQRNQPIVQQLYEGAVGTALQGSITDQVNVTDYFDENTDGNFGSTAGRPNDTISRFAFFYTERLKMLNGDGAFIPQVSFFYNQLNEFINGETCQQNYTDHNSPLSPGVALNPSCMDPTLGSPPQDFCTEGQATTPDPYCTGAIPGFMTCAQNVFENKYVDPGTIALNPACTACSLNSSDPSCQMPVTNPFSFQLNDSCTDTTNPYCNACCQPMTAVVTSTTESDSGANIANQSYKAVRPSSCYPYTAGYPVVCATNPAVKSMTTGQAVCNLSDLANAGYSLSGSPQTSTCLTNNPYGSGYPFIYDPTYQNYADGLSFLDQYGRDMQMLEPSPTGPLPLTGITVQGAFPNGVYPFFWLMKDYVPQVDNLNVDNGANFTSAAEPWYHWCVAGSYPGGKVPAVSSPSTTDFSDLEQLTLPYTCSGQDCCVDYLTDNLNNGTATSNTLNITVGQSGLIKINSPSSGNTFTINPSPLKITIQATVSEPAPGAVASYSFYLCLPGQAAPCTSNEMTLSSPTVSPPLPSSSSTITGTLVVPSTVPGVTPCQTLPSGTYTLMATATDSDGNTENSNYVTMTINNPGYCASSDNCGTDACGKTCGGGTCTDGQQCYANEAVTASPGTCSCASGTLGDSNNCGKCGAVCPDKEACQDNSTCACSSGTLGDNNNCGNCGNACAANYQCTDGVCACSKPCGTQCCSSTETCNTATGSCS